MIRGSGLCGGFQFEINARVSDLHRCHCSICRKATGAGAIAMLATAHKSLKWVCGEQTIRRFERPSGWSSSFYPPAAPPRHTCMTTGSSGSSRRAASTTTREPASPSIFSSARSQAGTLSRQGRQNLTSGDPRTRADARIQRAEPIEATGWRNPA